MSVEKSRGHPHVSIPWEHFPIGASVFIPTVHMRATEAYLERISSTYDYNLQWRVASRSGLIGLRVWRLDDIIE